MSKFTFVRIGKGYELSRYSNNSRMAEFQFPKDTRGYISIGSHSFTLSFGKTEANLNGFKDGEYIPKLITEQEEFLLPKIRKCGNEISFAGYSDEELCSKFDELRKLRHTLRELCEKYKTLEEYVFGKGIF